MLLKLPEAVARFTWLASVTVLVFVALWPCFSLLSACPAVTHLIHRKNSQPVSGLRAAEKDSGRVLRDVRQCLETLGL